MVAQQPDDATLIRFTKAYPAAPPIAHADRSAGGSIPAGAFQYCEALRTASSLGWYIYPPKDISLLYSGSECCVFDEEQWYPVKSQNFEDSFRARWNNYAPDDLEGYDPPFLTEIFNRGDIQIWSGYFVSTAPDWSIIIRPTVNFGQRHDIMPYEGIVETFEFQPFPLFCNFRCVRRIQKFSYQEIDLYSNYSLYTSRCIMH